MQPVKLYDTFIKKTYWCLEFAPNCIGGCGGGGYYAVLILMTDAISNVNFIDNMSIST